MDNSPISANEFYAKLDRAWLITWEWTGDHAQVDDKFVAIISSRFKDKKVREMLEQYFASNYLSLREQINCVKSKRSHTYNVQLILIAVSNELQQKASAMPSQVPFSESMIIGGNPWLWARIVYKLETWREEGDVEWLKWNERENISWDGKSIKSDWGERKLKR